MTRPEMEEVVERVEGMEKRLAYQGRLAKHYTGEGATNAIERKMCEESGKDAEALRALLSERRKMVEALRPFVDYAGHIDDGETFSDDSEIVSVLSGGIRRSIRFRDLRKARAALTGSREQEADHGR